jgi:hypothetical protein
MLFRETVTVYCEHGTHRYTLWAERERERKKKEVGR